MERLAVDIELGAAAVEQGDRDTANSRLTNAQGILLHLRSTLDLKAWPAGAAVSSLYLWCYQELVAANIGGDAARARGCLPTVTTLRDSWTEAARLVSLPPAAAS